MLRLSKAVVHDVVVDRSELEAEADRDPVGHVRRPFEPAEKDLLVGQPFTRDEELVLDAPQVDFDVELQPADDAKLEIAGEKDTPLGEIV